MRVLRGIYGYQRYQECDNVTDKELLTEAGLAATDVVMMRRRLKIIGKAVRDGPPALVALLRQGRTDFGAQTGADLGWLWRHSEAPWVARWPDPAVEPAPWLHLLTDPRGQAMDELFAAVPVGATALPVRVKPVRHVAMDVVPEGGFCEGLGWVCGRCPAGKRRVLDTFTAALRGHEAMLHGLHRPAQH